MKGQIIWKNESIRIVTTDKSGDYVVECLVGYDPEGKPEWKPSTSLSTDIPELHLIIRTLSNKLGAMISRMREEERSE